MKIRRLFNYLNYNIQKKRHPELVDYHVYIAALNYSPASIRFFLDKGGELLNSCPLSSESIVFDVGGDIGNWAQTVKEKYDPTIYIFEPNPRSCNRLKEKFKQDQNIAVFPYGLADQNTSAKLSLMGMGSSVFEDSPNYHTKNNHVVIDLRDVKQVMEELKLSSVDLFKINIEGGEYPLLHRMIETNLFEMCRYIRIQFHEWYPNSHALRRQIRQTLDKTHRIEWDYPFVWESWLKK